MELASKAKKRNNAFVLSQLLIALAIFMRVIIPQGFMLGETSQSENGKQISIVICTAQGELPATIDENGDINFDNKAPDNHNGKSKSASSHCTFASALSDFSFSPNVFGYTSANWNFAFSQSRAEVTQIGHGLAAPPPPKTGPPIFA